VKFFVASLLLLFSSFISRLSFHSASINPLPLSCRYTERQPEEDYLNRQREPAFFFVGSIKKPGRGEGINGNQYSKQSSARVAKTRSLQPKSNRSLPSCLQWVQRRHCRTGKLSSSSFFDRRRRRSMPVLVGRVILDPREFRVANADEPISTWKHHQLRDDLNRHHL
jgi:hypothetical protein